MKPWFVWPPGVDPEKFFPGEGRLSLQTETRYSSHMKQCVGGANSIRAALGITPRETAPIVHRSDDGVNQELRTFVETNNRRPTKADLPNTARWLQKRGTSIHRRCNELGLAGGRNMDRTEESTNEELRAFHATWGRQPTVREMPKVEMWLRTKGSSLSRRWGELDLGTKKAA